MSEKEIQNCKNMSVGCHTHRSSRSRCGSRVWQWLPARPADKPRGLWTTSTHPNRTHCSWAYRRQRASRWRTKKNDSCAYLWLYSVVPCLHFRKKNWQLQNSERLIISILSLKEKLATTEQWKIGYLNFIVHHAHTLHEAMQHVLFCIWISFYLSV